MAIHFEDGFGIEPWILTQILPLISALSLFLFCITMLTLLMRKWYPHHTEMKTVPIHAVTWFPSFCGSMICTAIIFGETLPAIIFPIIYSIVGTLIAA